MSSIPDLGLGLRRDAGTGHFVENQGNAGLGNPCKAGNVGHGWPAITGIALGAAPRTIGFGHPLPPFALARPEAAPGVVEFLYDNKISA